MNPQRQQQQSHRLPYDLNDETSRSELTAIIEKAINEDDANHSQYWDEWDQVDDRLAGDITPPGWQTDAVKVLAAMNDPTFQAKETAKRMKYFATINRTRPNNESVLGDFVASRRKLVVNAENPTDHNRAKVVQKRLEYIERSELLFHRVVVPMMDHGFARGVHWADVEFDPFANALKGKITVRPVSCRDVLVDHTSQGTYFDTMRRLTVRTKMSTGDAYAEYNRYPLFRAASIGGDTDYDRPYLTGRKSRIIDTNFITTYKYQFRQRESRYFAINPKDGSTKEISFAIYNKLLQDPRYEPFVFEGEREDKYYTALYNRSIGVFDLKWNPFGQWMTIPLVNFYDEKRTYHLGDVMVYANLSDLLDTVVTVFVQNAKRTNKPIAEADPQLYDEYKTAIDTALEKGGAAPGIKQVFDIKSINSHIVMLVPWLIQWIQDSISKHSASQGELPANQVAEATVKTLIARDRSAHGRKDVMLEWTLTMMARLFAKIICKFDTEPSFFPLLDMSTTSRNYIPINQAWTEDEYISNLAQMAGMQIPQEPPIDAVPEQYRQQILEQYQQQQAQFEQQMWVLRQKFEQENDVKPEVVDGYVTADGSQYTAEDLADVQDQVMREKGYTEDEFNGLYKPQQAQIKVYMVNILDEDLDLSLRVSIDSDFASDPQYIANRAMALMTMQPVPAMSRVDGLRDMKVPDAENVVARADEENKAIQLAKEISDAAQANPQIMEQIVAVMNAAQQNLGKRKNGQQVPEGATTQ